MGIHTRSASRETGAVDTPYRTKDSVQTQIVQNRKWDWNAGLRDTDSRRDRGYKECVYEETSAQRKHPQRGKKRVYATGRSLERQKEGKGMKVYEIWRSENSGVSARAERREYEMDVRDVNRHKAGRR